MKGVSAGQIAGKMLNLGGTAGFADQIPPQGILGAGFLIFIFRAIDFIERVIVRMELKLTEVAERIRTLREIMGFTTQEMADTLLPFHLLLS